MVLLVGGMGWVHVYVSLIVLDMCDHREKRSFLLIFRRAATEGMTLAKEG